MTSWPGHLSGVPRGRAGEPLSDHPLIGVREPAAEERLIGLGGIDGRSVDVAELVDQRAGHPPAPDPECTHRDADIFPADPVRDAVPAAVVPGFEVDPDTRVVPDFIE